ncbi:MAG: precorrin-6A reductase [Desulfobacteraceae bacterium]|nr:MAG: precorrin-6A reductase [Desulfobacteraceae bacterium]
MAADAQGVPRVILLFGGTSETAPLADMLAGAGYEVLVSIATPIELAIGRHSRVRRRIGRLDAAGMVDLIQTEQVRAVVDAAHPYAEQLHAIVARACQTARVRLLRYRRPSVPVPDRKGIQWAVDHATAAALACRPGSRVLLTIGSRNIAPYVRAAVENQADVFARVLPESDSLDACRMVGLSLAQVIGMRGPFSREDNLNLLHQLRIDVLVTKESGIAGGFKEKIEAALERKCRVVIIQRPVESGAAECRSFEEIVEALQD